MRKVATDMKFGTAVVGIVCRARGPGGCTCRFLKRVRFFVDFRLPRSVLATCRLRRITENCGLAPNATIKGRLCVFRPDGVSAKKPKRQDDRPRMGLLKKVRMLNTSEYGSGLEPAKKPKKS